MSDRAAVEPGAPQVSVAGRSPVLVRTQSIPEKVKEYEEFKTAAVTSERHVGNVIRFLDDIITQQKWSSYEDITADSIRKYLIYRSKKDSKKTCNEARSAISGFCDFLKSDNLIETNPVKGIPRFRMVKRRARVVPTAVQVRLLIMTVAKDSRKKDRWLVHLVRACTGIRPETARLLEWPMVKDLDGPGFPRLDMPGKILKAKDPACVFLTRECAHWLRWWRDIRAKWGPTPKATKVFLSVGKVKEFDRDLHCAKLPKSDPGTGATFAPGSLRHFANMRMAGASRFTVKERQEQMDHDTPKMTIDTYFDPAHEELAKKVWSMENLLPEGFRPPDDEGPREKKHLPPRNPLDNSGALSRISGVEPKSVRDGKHPSNSNAAHGTRHGSTPTVTHRWAALDSDGFDGAGQQVLVQQASGSQVQILSPRLTIQTPAGQ